MGRSPVFQRVYRVAIQPAMQSGPRPSATVLERFVVYAARRFVQIPLCVNVRQCLQFILREFSFLCIMVSVAFTNKLKDSARQPRLKMAGNAISETTGFTFAVAYVNEVVFKVSLLSNRLS